MRNHTLGPNIIHRQTLPKKPTSLSVMLGHRVVRKEPTAVWVLQESFRKESLSRKNLAIP